MTRAAMAVAVVLTTVFHGQLLAENSPKLSVKMVSNTEPCVTVTGDAGIYTLQYASVLGAQTNWVELTNLTLTGTSINWLDYSGAGQAQRFYRALATSNSVPANPAPDLLVWIPEGTFNMGSPTTEASHTTDETQHTVVISKGFYMSKYLVRQGEYLSVVGSNPSYFAPRNGKTLNTNLPVETVSWIDANIYCALLNQQEQAAGRLPSGWAYRLPTESEWEYACRAGTTTAFYFGDIIHWPNANFYTYYEYDASVGDITTNKTGVGYEKGTTPVGRYAPNLWGLYDMCGNVNEWCQDWNGTYPTGTVTDPTGPSSGSSRVFRGGGWSLHGVRCRSAFRNSFAPGTASNFVGFRPVLAPSQP